ncbi:MAG: 3-phosphoshikimate 1-carboxyvinyltransferase [Planctomycetia bacterium]|nr:3-phosphoshikimate 1-carboxyvinyltransferase [Planctomycetia bacterium]
MMDYPEMIQIRPKGPIRATITPPGSKSITNRVLPVAALAEGNSVLRGVLDSEDTRIMMDALRLLGITLQHDVQESEVFVKGCGGNLQIPENRMEIFCGNSGTSLRFLSGILSIFHGDFLLDGIPRMRQRPMGDMIHAMKKLGVDISSVYGNDCPPVHIRAAGLHGGITEIAGSASSQYLSGLLMACAYAHSPTLLRVRGNLVSRPYVEMTISVMEDFGADVFPVDLTQDMQNETHCMAESDLPIHTGKGSEEKVSWEFLVPPRQIYTGRDYMIEPDASAASYFFAAAAVLGGEVTVMNLSKNSLQGDVAFCECLEKMGCEVHYMQNSIRVSRDPDSPLHGVDVDMHHISDTAQTLAVVALFADSPTTIRNVANMRLKETDRIHALVTELRKFGVSTQEYSDGLTVHPLQKTDETWQWEITADIPSVNIETWGDHRMAMSFAVAGLKRPNVMIHDPGCVAKTYPQFFEDLAKLQ